MVAECRDAWSELVLCRKQRRFATVHRLHLSRQRRVCALGVWTWVHSPSVLEHAPCSPQSMQRRWQTEVLACDSRRVSRLFVRAGPNTVVFNFSSYIFFSVGLATNTLVGRFLREGGPPLSRARTPPNHPLPLGLLMLGTTATDLYRCMMREGRWFPVLWLALCCRRRLLALFLFQRGSVMGAEGARRGDWLQGSRCRPAEWCRRR